MKSPLIYLTVIKLKNQLKETIRHPSRLIYGVFLVAMLVLVVVSGNVEGEMDLRPLSELTAIMVLFYSMMFLFSFMNGVNGGAGNYPMFTLSDVSILFPSPLRPNKVLAYGLFRQLGLSLLMGFFLLFQYSWLHRAYGLEYAHLLLIVAGYALSLFLGQVCAMAAYTRTSGNDSARQAVKYTVYGLTIAFVAWMLWSALPAGLFSGQGLSALDTMGVVEKGAAFLSTVGVYFPVSGWAAGFIGGLLAGDYVRVGISLALMAATFGIMLLLVIKNKNNYYEDVLQTAETAQSAITAKKEGQPAEVIPKKVRVGKTGLNQGTGAGVIFFKHMVENRRSGVFLFSKMTVIFMAIIIGTAFLYGQIFSEKEGKAALAALFAMSTYMQMFSEGMGRFSWELSKPYLYLIPEPPFKKLLMATAETLLADCFEAVVIYVPVSAILGLDALTCVLCILARISFALLFTSGNIMVERVFGTVRSKGLMMFFYFIALILLALPGLGLGLGLNFSGILPGSAGTLLGITAGNIPVALIVMFLCRNLLQYAELNGK